MQGDRQSPLPESSRSAVFLLQKHNIIPHHLQVSFEDDITNQRIGMVQTVESIRVCPLYYSTLTLLFNLPFLLISFQCVRSPECHHVVPANSNIESNQQRTRQSLLVQNTSLYKVTEIVPDSLHPTCSVSPIRRHPP